MLGAKGVVRKAKCEVHNAKCLVRKAKCKKRSAWCEVRKAWCEVRNAKCVVRKVPGAWKKAIANNGEIYGIGKLMFFALESKLSDLSREQYFDNVPEL